MSKISDGNSSTELTQEQIRQKRLEAFKKRGIISSHASTAPLTSEVSAEPSIIDDKASSSSTSSEPDIIRELETFLNQQEKGIEEQLAQARETINNAYEHNKADYIDAVKRNEQEILKTIEKASRDLEKLLAQQPPQDEKIAEIYSRLVINANKADKLKLIHDPLLTKPIAPAILRADKIIGKALIHLQPQPPAEREKNTEALTSNTQPPIMTVLEDREITLEKPPSSSPIRRNSTASTISIDTAGHESDDSISIGRGSPRSARERADSFFEGELAEDDFSYGSSQTTRTHSSLFSTEASSKANATSSTDKKASEIISLSDADIKDFLRSKRLRSKTTNSEQITAFEIVRFGQNEILKIEEFSKTTLSNARARLKKLRETSSLSKEEIAKKCESIGTEIRKSFAPKLNEIKTINDTYPEIINESKENLINTAPQQKKHLTFQENFAKNIYGIALGVGLIGAIIAEIGSKLLTGKSLFLEPLKEIGSSASKSPTAFEKFFREHPAGSVIESAVEFLGSKPVKRALRIALILSTVLISSAATGGAVGIAAIAVTTGGILVNSIREYNSQKKMTNKIKEGNDLLNLRKGLTEVVHKICLEGIKAEKSGKSFDRNEQLNQLVNFLYDGSRKVIPNNERVIEPNPLWSKFRAFGSNLIESVGSMLVGDFSEALTLFIAGTNKEAELLLVHDNLKKNLYVDRNADKKAITDLLAPTGHFSAEKTFNYKNPEQLKEMLKKQKFVESLLVSQDEKIFPLSKKQLDSLYKAQIAKDKEKELSEKNRLSPFEKIKERFKSFVETNIVSNLIGYIKTAIPSKKYQYNPELLEMQRSNTRTNFLSYNQETLSRHTTELGFSEGKIDKPVQETPFHGQGQKLGGKVLPIRINIKQIEASRKGLAVREGAVKSSNGSLSSVTTQIRVAAIPPADKSRGGTSH